MDNNKNPTSGAVVVSWDFSHGDSPLVLVGRQVKGNSEIVNAFTGDEARELYEKLTKSSDILTKEDV